MAGRGNPTDDEIVATLRRSAAALKDAEVPFMLAGSLAFWARGAPLSRNDVDLMVPPADAERAVAALAAQGMEVASVPETWLRKVWDGNVMVDLLTSLLGSGEVTEEWIDSAERLRVLGITMPVASLEAVMSAKLLSLSEHELDYGPTVSMARSLREQVDWDVVRRSVDESPYGRAFFSLLRELQILDTADVGDG